MDPPSPPAASTSSSPPAVVHSRWRASQTSFGPVGRLIATVLLLLPMVFFWKTQTFGWPGLVIWGGFLLPWGLRDVWRRSRVRSS
jgi:hypothetical protein